MNDWEGVWETEEEDRQNEIVTVAPASVHSLASSGTWFSAQGHAPSGEGGTPLASAQCFAIGRVLHPHVSSGPCSRPWELDVPTFTGQAQRHLTIEAACLKRMPPCKSGGVAGPGFRAGIAVGDGSTPKRVHSPRSIWLVPVALRGEGRR